MGSQPRKSIFGFDARRAGVLRRMADGLLAGGSGEDFHRPSNQSATWVVQAVSVITPAVTSVGAGGVDERVYPGSGLIRVCYLDKVTGRVEPHLPDGSAVTATIYSLLPFAIPVGRFILAERDLRATLWAVAPSDDQDLYGSGSGSGSGGDCLDVVTDVQFDPATCQLTVCTRRICLPAGSTIGDETCGDGSGGSGG